MKTAVIWSMGDAFEDRLVGSSENALVGEQGETR